VGIYRLAVDVTVPDEVDIDDTSLTLMERLCATAGLIDPVVFATRGEHRLDVEAHVRAEGVAGAMASGTLAIAVALEAVGITVEDAITARILAPVLT
jgi:ribosomal protein S9